MELIAPQYDNSVGTNWTTAVTEYGDGDLGSPGRRNDAFSGSIVVSDSLFSFGGVVEGDTKDDTLYISNSGVRTLTINSISSSMDEFVFSDNSLTVGIGDTLELYVEFTPNNPGLYQDTLLIESDDPVRQLLQVPLTAFGISEAADITIASSLNASLSSYGFPLP